MKVSLVLLYYNAYHYTMTKKSFEWPQLPILLMSTFWSCLI